MKKAAVIGGTNIIGCEYKLCSLEDDFDVLIVSFLTNDMLAQSALGLKTPISDSIAKEKEVIIINTGLEYKQIKNRELFKLYDKYSQTLKKYGVKFSDELKITTSDMPKRLITAGDIKNCIAGELIVPKNAVITPLAHDIAREKNIKIRVEGL